MMGHNLIELSLYTWKMNRCAQELVRGPQVDQVDHSEKVEVGEDTEDWNANVVLIYWIRSLD